MRRGRPQSCSCLASFLELSMAVCQVQSHAALAWHPTVGGRPIKAPCSRSMYLGPRVNARREGTAASPRSWSSSPVAVVKELGQQRDSAISWSGFQDLRPVPRFLFVSMHLCTCGKYPNTSVSQVALGRKVHWHGTSGGNPNSKLMNSCSRNSPGLKKAAPSRRVASYIAVGTCRGLPTIQPSKSKSGS